MSDLDLENRKAPIRSNGGAKEEVYWGHRNAHLRSCRTTLHLW
jgi:hypothetical protein